MVFQVKLVRNNALKDILYRNPEVSWFRFSAGPMRSVQVQFYFIGKAFHLFFIKSYKAVCVWGGGGLLFLKVFIVLVTYVT